MRLRFRMVLGIVPLSGFLNQQYIAFWSERAWWKGLRWKDLPPGKNIIVRRRGRTKCGLPIVAIWADISHFNSQWGILTLIALVTDNTYMALGCQYPWLCLSVQISLGSLFGMSLQRWFSPQFWEQQARLLWAAIVVDFSVLPLFKPLRRHQHMPVEPYRFKGFTEWARCE